MVSRFEEARDVLVASVEAGLSLPDAARAADLHPSTAKGYVTRGRRGEEPYAEFVAQLDAAREQVRARPGALSEDEFRERLEPIALHECRHTAATEMRAAGLDFKMIQSIIGHSSVTTTFDRYTHVSREHLRAAAAQFEAHVQAASGPIPDQ